MSKKKYILWLILGSLLITFILPIINYSNDQWRVLHRDYKYSYINSTINKGFLKTSYLLNTKKRYDLLMFGSSRNAAFVENDISKNGYNAYSDFAVVGNHLNTLKILLENGIIPKKVWIGLNDFDIWKNPNDFNKDYSKFPYPNSIKNWFSFYKLYLFKAIDNSDLDIWKGKKYLEISNRIYRKHLDKHKEYLIKRESNIVSKGEKWKKKLTRMAATLLEYQDKSDIYRIDKSIKEIKEIISLSKKYKFKTTFFIYPSFYKTYVLYNQNKIEEFKRKLAKVTNFYDFYKLDKTSFNELKWFDTSHFLYSVGIKIINNIQNNKNLITKDNVEDMLTKERVLHKNLLEKALPIPYIMRLNKSINIPNTSKIWDISESINKTNNQLVIKKSKVGYILKNLGEDPNFYINKLSTSTKNVLFECEIETSTKSLFQIFYKTNQKDTYQEKNSAKFVLYKGNNVLKMLIPSKFLLYGLRIDNSIYKGINIVKKCRILQ